MSHYEMLLRCISGLFQGKFLYLNSNEPEILGSGSFDDHGVTASLQDCNLESIHTKIQFKSDYYISDLSSSKGTFLRVPPGSTYQFSNTSQIKLHKSVFAVSSLSKSPPCLTLTSGRMVLTVHDFCRVSNKKPADFVIPSLDDFLAVIRFVDENFEILIETGSVALRLTEEKRLEPGDQVIIGDLEFEACRFNYGKWSTVGQRAAMEDSDLVIQDLRVLDESVAYYAVFDGHGGSQCSNFLKENLHKFIQKHLKGCRDLNIWQERIYQAFEECDHAFEQSFPILSRQIGSAALVCLIYKNSLVTVNCGDCRAVLSRGGQAIQLTTDHKPDLPSERMRIEKAAGFVCNGRVQGKLGLSRAFGDFEYKLCSAGQAHSNKNSGKIVICQPEVIINNLDLGVDEFLVIACDGLFEAFSNPDLVKQTRNRLKRMKVTEQDPGRVVKDLVTEAVHTRRTLDNVTAVLISFCAGLA